MICWISPSPHAAAINNKQKDNKLNKKQNKGSKQRTGRNNGGVVDNDVIEKLLIHDQKKIPEHRLLRDRLSIDQINRTTEQHSPAEAEECSA